MDFPEHPFWDFAIEVYGREGVSRACLQLQERHGIDVNVLLFCLWVGARGLGVMSDAEVARIKAISDRWQDDVVRHLRGVRRALKDGCPGAPAGLCERLRAEVQRVEIDSEHLEQLVLAGAVVRETAGKASTARLSGDATENFARYVATLNSAFEPSDTVHFAHILGQAFPELSPDEALDHAELLM